LFFGWNLLLQWACFTRTKTHKKMAFFLFLAGSLQDSVFHELFAIAYTE
jgi:hypothetical protein